MFALIAALFLSFGLLKGKYQVALEVTAFSDVNIAAAKSMISSKYDTKLGITLFAISVLLEIGALAFTELFIL